MSWYAMTYRTPAGLRMQPVLAADLAAAWDRAFDLCERQSFPVRGFGLRRVGGA
ncbi:hypothetical protein Acica_36 [Acidovorax phage Acica]|nr:hypothetical protein Acica_36 [Acidovorax phage Acica]